jgi:hypothetical protein
MPGRRRGERRGRGLDTELGADATVTADGGLVITRSGVVDGGRTPRGAVESPGA